METLDEYNKRRRADHDAMQRAMSNARANGIACPKCSKELFDSNPFETLTSSPPQKRVRCECGYVGYRVA